MRGVLYGVGVSDMPAIVVVVLTLSVLVSLRALAAQRGPSHQLEIGAKSLGMTWTDE
jgi:hypothetical protein